MQSDQDINSIETELRTSGFAFRQAPFLQRLVAVDEAQWKRFAASWNDLGPDRYMADGGRYRRRRFAALKVLDAEVEIKPRQPHFQSRDYNALNGGVERWFEPVRDEILKGPVLDGLLKQFSPSFDALDRREGGAVWHTEVHQFRIETSPAETGRPTPEGMHRDGVDWVLVLLVSRQNVEEGITELGGPEGNLLNSFVLQNPGDLVLLDDRKLRHGVTQIIPKDISAPAYRDVLVVTWRGEGPDGE